MLFVLIRSEHLDMRNICDLIRWHFEFSKWMNDIQWQNAGEKKRHKAKSKRKNCPNKPRIAIIVQCLRGNKKWSRLCNGKRHREFSCANIQVEKSFSKYIVDSNNIKTTGVATNINENRIAKTKRNLVIILKIKGFFFSLFYPSKKPQFKNYLWMLMFIYKHNTRNTDSNV